SITSATKLFSERLPPLVLPCNVGKTGRCSYATCTIRSGHSCLRRTAPTRLVAPTGKTIGVRLLLTHTTIERRATGVCGTDRRFSAVVRSHFNWRVPITCTAIDVLFLPLCSVG